MLQTYLVFKYSPVEFQETLNKVLEGINNDPKKSLISIEYRMAGTSMSCYHSALITYKQFN